MLFYIGKQKKSGVGDLNSMERVLLFSPDDTSFLKFSIGPFANPRPFVGALRCQGTGEAFGPRQQFACMVFAQLTWREGLRVIEACVNTKPEASSRCYWQ